MNSGKCHLLIAGYKFELIWTKIGTDLIWESNSAKLLGITIDNHLKFDIYIYNNIFPIYMLKHVENCLVLLINFPSKRTLIKAFFESQFRYCSLTSMFRSRKSNNEINLLHERALRTIYNHQIPSFQEPLDKDNSFTFTILISSHLLLKCLKLSII